MALLPLYCLDAQRRCRPQEQPPQANGLAGLLAPPIFPARAPHRPSTSNSIMRWATNWIICLSRPASAPFSTNSVNAIVGLVIVVSLVKVKSANSTLAKNHDDHPLSPAGRLRLVQLHHFPGHDPQRYDLLILDVMMPGLKGWEVLRMVRAPGEDAPVLFLTARDGGDDRVEGLESGADDYLIKPFAFSELLARVRTLLSRGTSTAAQNTMKMADLEVDLLKRRATRSGKRVDLTAKEFSLLVCLMRRRGEGLSNH